MRFHLYRPLKGEVRDVEIKRVAGRWFVCIVCDIGPAPERKPVRTAVGIDLGLTCLAMLSTGERIENPRWYRRAEEKLAQRQRVLARRCRGSASRRRARLLVAKQHERVRNQRLDHARKFARDLVGRFDLIAFEDLQIGNMVRGTLGKSIMDAGWGMLVRSIQSKAEEAGTWAVPVAPHGTSQRCSRCGQTVRKDLSVRIHQCGCGLILDRDENAARNIYALGLSVVSTSMPVVDAAEAST